MGQLTGFLQTTCSIHLAVSRRRSGIDGRPSRMQEKTSGRPKRLERLRARRACRHMHGPLSESCDAARLRPA